MKVRLRPLEPEDSDRLLVWRNQPDVAAQMYTDHEITPNEHRAWFAAARAGGDRRYWIVEMAGRPVGLAGLVRIDRTNRRCDLSHYLAEPGARGRGVGAAVEYGVLAQAFSHLQLNKLWAEVLSGNERASRLHETFGFTREACLRDHVWKRDGFHDVIGWGMTARDWAPRRAAAADRLRQREIDPDRLFA